MTIECGSRAGRCAHAQVPKALRPSITKLTSMKTQFYAGGTGTGAPAHFHRSAWNALVFGVKRWSLRPPPHALYSTVHPTEARDVGGDANVLQCVQRAGDVIFVPDAWGHAVVNLAPSVGFAQEFLWGAPEFSL